MDFTMKNIDIFFLKWKLKNEINKTVPKTKAKAANYECWHNIYLQNKMKRSTLAFNKQQRYYKYKYYKKK